MAGTISIPAPPYASLRIPITWTSDSSGNASGTLTSTINGSLLQVEFSPSASAAPTSNYDVQILDDASFDVLGGTGADRSASVAEREFPNIDGAPVILAGTHTLAITNAGNAKSGTIYLFVR